MESRHRSPDVKSAAIAAVHECEKIKPKKRGKIIPSVALEKTVLAKTASPSKRMVNWLQAERVFAGCVCLVLSALVGSRVAGCGLGRTGST